MPRAFVPADIFRLASLSGLTVSPDGTRAAVVVTRLDQTEDEYRSAIWTLATDGSAPPRQLTYGPKRDTAPKFSPGGRFIAFVRDDGSSGDDAKRPQLWAIRTDGGEAWRLTDVPNGVTAPAWSPDGSALAFLSRMTPEDGMSAEEKRKHRARGRVIERLRYRFNAEGFTYDRPQTIWRVPFAESGRCEAVRLTDGAFSDGPPAWSPDGSLLAFASARHEGRDRDSVSDIWTMPAAGDEPSRVTRSTGPAASPRVSPDGDTIAYLGHEHAIGGGFNTKLWTVPTSGDAEPTCLSGAFDHTLVENSLAWTADGAAIDVLYQDRGTVHLARVPASGGAPTPLLTGERQIAEFAVRLGRVTFIASGACDPAEVYAANIDGSDQRALTTFNAEFAEEVHRAAPESITFTSADGTPVQGWLYKPFGFEDGRTYPVLFNIHGGPHAQNGYTYFDEFQVQAGRGYGVFCVNFRGSTGYGERFAESVNGNTGVLDSQDLMAGLDALVQVPWVDESRIGVLGGSYGGYMTSWLIGHTDRFKAACSERAVNNWLSKVGTSDIGFLQHREIGADPWDDPLHFLHRSPIFYVKQITTPTLIIHSEQDLRCPIEQGEQLYTALMLQGTPTRFVRFPEENHELSRNGKPSRRIQRFEEQLAWFGRWLT